jgi:release factor glutamine methyltransferase
LTVAEALAGCGIDLLEARMLLARATGLSRAALAAHPEQVLDAAAEAGFLESAARRRAGEPVAYLLGEREFYGLTLGVNPAVLIPRPESELLVEFALEHLPSSGTVLDLGTGSGAIALAIKHERPDARVTAVEKSATALAVAQANAVRHRLEIGLMLGNWFEPLAGRRFDLVVSNPPYVASDDRHLEQGDLRFEPRNALVGGADGLDEIRRIVAKSPTHLNRGGWLAIEHGQGQDLQVSRSMMHAGLESVSSRPDLAGIARISVGKYNLD